MEAFDEPVEVVLKTRPLSSDPSDDMVLDVVINGRAEALVTNDTKHLVGAGVVNPQQVEFRRSIERSVP